MRNLRVWLSNSLTEAVHFIECWLQSYCLELLPRLYQGKTQANLGKRLKDTVFPAQASPAMLKT